MEQSVAAHLSERLMMATLIEGEYYDGAYGPTILLASSTFEGIRYMLSVIEGLARNGVGTSVRLEDDPNVALGGALWAMHLNLVGTSSQKHLTRRSEGGFIWECASGEWDEVGHLIEPLTGQSGHQYLTNEYQDDALVEISFAEEVRRN